ncbi:MAG: hypothetical protein GY765_03775, partial [bacterium]|nr:hypothetical protein [bacterium]
MVSQTQYEPPGTATEKKLTKIWREVLGTEEQIGINDNFFEIGGHSLKATTLISSIHKEMEIEIPLTEIFRAPTIRGLATILEGAGTSTRFEAIRKAPEQETYPLSSVQRRMYMAQVTNPGNISYNLPQVMEVVGALQRAQIERILHQIIHRHESFRTAFQLTGMQPAQQILDNVAFRVQYYQAINETTARDASGREIQIKTLIDGFVRPFDLSQPPALRVG